MRLINNTWEFTSTPSPKSYLEAELGVYIKTQGRHNPGYKYSAIKTTDAGWVLVAEATVIAQYRIADPTPVIELDMGEHVFIDGIEYQLVDDRPLHDPRFVEVGL